MRLKIVAGNLAVVVLLGLAAYVIVSQQLKDRLVAQLDGDISNDRSLFERSYKLSAYEFTDLVSTRANDNQLRSVFSGLDVSSRRTRAYEAAESTQAWLADPARGGGGAPDLVVVTDETGTALARNGARNVMFGKKLAQDMPALATALKSGGAAHDAWLEAQENKVLQVAVAAIRGEQGTVLGALVVGYDLSNGMATREAKLLGHDVAVVVEGNVYSSSLSGTKSKLLKDSLFGEQGAAIAGVLGGNKATRVFTAHVGKTEYAAVAAPLPMSPSHAVAFTVLGNRTQALTLVDSANIIIIMTVLSGLLVLAYGFFLGSSIMRQIERIEEDVLAVINGRTDLRLDTDSEDLGGLAFRINQLLNVFTGTEEGSDDGEGSVPPSSAHWQGAAFSEGGGGGGAAPAAPSSAGAAAQDEVVDDPAVAIPLAGEDEAAYNARIYSEYVAAKQSLGENVSNIPQDRFQQRITARGAALAKKHGCRAVRFRVETLDNQVLLRPVLIR